MKNNPQEPAPENINLNEQWLDNGQVIKMLGISKRTLQTLRSNGTLPHTKLGKTCFYSLTDVQLMMFRNRIGGR